MIGKTNVAIILLAVIGWSCQVKQQSGEMLVANDSLVYSLVLTVLDSDSSCVNVVTRLGADQNILADRHLAFIASMDSIFTDKEMDHLREQMKDTSIFMLDPSRIKQRLLLSDSLIMLKGGGPSAFWRRLESKYGEGGFCAVSRPYFTSNLKYAVVKFGLYCGSLCGHEELRIYRRDGGQWKFVAKGNERFS